MSEQHWDRLRELFHHVLDMPPGERTAYLDDECPDSAMRAELESLLGPPAGNVLGSPVVDGVREAIHAAMERTEPGPPDSGTEGMLIGRYRLLEKIGEGGMGEVWRAEQLEPVRRQVALKLVRAFMNSREVVARFESERQALALMDHPAIARFYDAGSTPNGAPYFVMDYVEGAPITAYCDNHRLTIRERLELFIRVCEGVQHAHQKAIIHRDLKPSNILVTEVDGKAEPKIIDFGVAKALAPGLRAESMFTRAGAFVGTPEYMSPEQAASSGEDIDTRSDVFSLGVILYELLTGARPIKLQAITLEEFLRKLRKEEPEKPSSRIRRQDEAALSGVALNRQATPAALSKQLRGDLDSIAGKALEKERSLRYDAPSSLAADIGRYLRQEGVWAVPPSTFYRMGKFARRHSVALVVTAAFLLVLIAAAAISILQGMRANQEAAVARAVTDFVQNDLLAQASTDKQAGSKAKPDPDLKVRTALDRAAESMGSRFALQPKVEAEIRGTMGQTYLDLGLYPKARTQLERALELERRSLGAENPTTVRTISRLGYVAYLQGRYPEAEALDSQALEIQRRRLGADHPDTLYTLSNLAIVYYTHVKYPEAESIDRQILEIRRRVSGPKHPYTLQSMNNLAIVYYLEGKYAEAEELFSEILAIQREGLGAEHHDTLMSMMNLGNVYRQEGKYAQAEAILKQCLEIRRRMLRIDHPDRLMSMLNLGNVYLQEGKYAEAEALYKESLEIKSRVLGAEHASTLTSMNNLANVYSLEEKYAQAQPLFSKAIEIARRKLGEQNRSTIIFLSNFASMYQRQGKYAEAETYLAQALAALQHTVGAAHPDTVETAEDLALAKVSERKFTEGEALARQALNFYDQKQLHDWQRFRAESLLGASLAGQKKYAEAEQLLLDGYQGMIARKDRMGVPDWYHLDRAREWIVQLFVAWGQPQKAAAWKKK